MTLSVYVDVSIDPTNVVHMPVSSIIALFVGKFCGAWSECFHPVNSFSPSENTKTIQVDREVLSGLHILKPHETPDNIRHCKFPAAVSSNGRVVHCGLCSVLRAIIKFRKDFTYLLGERKNCLKACAEVSAWTKFCEVEMPSAVEKFLSLSKVVGDADKILEMSTLPDELLQLESHFYTPPVVSNVNKRKHEIMKRMRTMDKTSSENVNDKTKISQDNNCIILEHVFVEGIDFRLTDLVLVPCVTLIFNAWTQWTDDYSLIQPHLKKVFSWYMHVLSQKMVKETLTFVGLAALSFELKTTGGEHQLLEKRVPRIRDPDKKKAKVYQNAIDEVFTKVGEAGIRTKLKQHPVIDVRLPWNIFPGSVHPKDGDLPLSRLEKKCQQLENLAAAVKLVSQETDTIIDFCSGGGHLGLLLAFLLPSCSVVLVENKEESLSRALARIEALGLLNIVSFQSNLDYFDMPFDVGVCLHGCGVATDLVLQKCVARGAAFVVCPCCYGAIQDTHTMKYPQSSAFKDTGITYEDFRILAHAADQTQAEIAQSEQGKCAMEYVDTDRLHMAEECGYRTMLCTLSPSTCSPKNNLLIGLPPGRSISNDALSPNAQ